jgi:hypothetical protein
MQTCLQPNWELQPSWPGVVSRPGNPAHPDRSLGFLCSAVVPHPQLPFALLARADDSIHVLRSLPQPRSEAAEEPRGEWPGRPVPARVDRLHHYHSDYSSSSSSHDQSDRGPSSSSAALCCEQERADSPAVAEAADWEIGEERAAPMKAEAEEVAGGPLSEVEEGRVPAAALFCVPGPAEERLDCTAPPPGTAASDGRPVNDENLPPPDTRQRQRSGEEDRPLQSQWQSAEKDKDRDKDKPAAFFSIFRKQAAQGTEKRKLEGEHGCSAAAPLGRCSSAPSSRSVFPPQSQSQRKMPRLEADSGAAGRSALVVRCVSAALALNPAGSSGGAAAAARIRARASALPASLQRKKPS